MNPLSIILFGYSTEEPIEAGKILSAFIGWKRKTGLVTLAIACVLATGWMRSLRRSDDLLLVLGTFSLNVESKRGTLELMAHRIYGDKKQKLRHFHRSSWRTSQLQSVTTMFPTGSSQSPEARSWRYQNTQTFGGLKLAGGSTAFSGNICIPGLNEERVRNNEPKWSKRIETQLLAVPYIDLVVPLTLLSGWLLIFARGPNIHLDRRRISGMFTALLTLIFSIVWITGICDSGTVLSEEIVEFLSDWAIGNNGFSLKLMVIRATSSSVTLQKVVELPHFAIVIPLALVSVWLLFNKPRARKIESEAS